MHMIQIWPRLNELLSPLIEVGMEDLANNNNENE